MPSKAVWSSYPSLVPDLAIVREACVEVFALRGTHAWPPDVWEEPFAALAAELGLPVSTLMEAVEAAAAFIGEIEASKSL